jgi:hypothetical protein
MTKSVDLKPVLIGGVVLVALFMLGLSLTSGSSSAPPEQRQAEVQPAIVTATPPAPPTETWVPHPTGTPLPAPTPLPPQVIYIQAPPQIIYVQLPTVATAEAPQVQPSAASVLPAPPCIFFTGQEMLESWLSRHPEHFAELQRCNLPAAATQTPVVMLQTVVVPGPTFTATVPPPATATPTPTPVLTRGQVVINFAGAANPRPTVAKDFAVVPGSSAWDAIKLSIGIENITFRDFGGDLGIFISGFYGVVPTGNQFWQFLVNGKPASLGVSSYTVKNGDVIEFRIATF